MVEPKYQNTGRALEELRSFVTVDIQQRYFVGEIWEQLDSWAGRALGEEVDSSIGVTSIRNLIATYLMDVILDNLDEEIKLGVKIDWKENKTRELTPVETIEIVEIRKGIGDFIIDLLDEGDKRTDVEIFITQHKFVVESFIPEVSTMNVSDSFKTLIAEYILEWQKIHSLDSEIDREIVIQLNEMEEDLVVVSEYGPNYSISAVVLFRTELEEYHFSVSISLPSSELKRRRVGKDVN